MLGRTWKGSWTGKALRTWRPAMLWDWVIRCLPRTTTGPDYPQVYEERVLGKPGCSNRSAMSCATSCATSCQPGRTGDSQMSSKSFWPRTSRQLLWGISSNHFQSIMEYSIALTEDEDWILIHCSVRHHWTLVKLQPRHFLSKNSANDPVLR